MMCVNTTDAVSDNATDDMSDNATDVCENATGCLCTKGQSVYFRDFCYLYR